MVVIMVVAILFDIQLQDSRDVFHPYEGPH